MLPLGHAPHKRASLAAAVRAVSLVVCLALGLSRVALGQYAPPDDEGEDAAPLDSLHTFMGQFGLHPKYSSSLTLLEQSSSWRQGFLVTRAARSISANTSMDLSIDKNKSQSNYKKNGGKGHAEVAYEAGSLGGISSGARVDWRRSFERSDVNRRVENGSDVDVFLTSSVGELLLRDLLALPDTTGGLNWTMNGALGLTQARSILQNRNRLNNSLTQSDSTEASGSERRFDTRLSANSGQRWGVDLSARTSSGREDSYTLSRSLVGGNLTSLVVDAPNRNNSRSADGSLNFKPGRALDFDVSGHYSKGRQQLYDSSTREQDTRRTSEQRAETTIKSGLVPGVDLQLSGRSNVIDNRALNQSLNQGKREKWGEFSSTITTGDWMGLLRAIELSTELERSESKYRYSTGRNYRSTVNRVNQVVRRKLNRAVTVSAQGEGRMERYYYQDKSGDKDELRWFGAGTLSYRPETAFDARVTVDWTERQIVNISETVSRSNATESTYHVSADYNYRLSSAVSLGQKYQLSALYQVFDFDENSNNLIRTTQILSSISSRIGNNVQLNAEHKYAFKDNGSYVREEALSPRRYAKAQKENNQYLNVTTLYRLGVDFDVHATQKLEARQTRVLASKKVTSKHQLDFSGGINFDHRFSPLFAVKATIDRSSRWNDDPNLKRQNKDFWKISASMERRF